MTELSKAVFLSYASEDAEAARRICAALRAGGVEVWFDQSELRGGDAWDRQIRRQIRDCALFIPIISAHSQARLEGYFRLEWRLAVERTHLMADRMAFLVPVVIDDTQDQDAEVPDSFTAFQWTRLPAGETPAAFVARIAQLLSPGQLTAAARAPPSSGPVLPRPPTPSTASFPRSKLVPPLIAAVTLLGAGYFALDRFVVSKHRAAPAPPQSVSTAVPERSIAVLPFVNMSSDKEQEYFSDGLTEEMIDLLSQVPELRVPARTSSFYFKGKNETIANMAQQLKVAHVLEGSVRKAGHHLRISAQLIRASNGYHLWSQTYDREDKDIFSVQDSIAQAVVGALKLKLSAGTPETSSRGTNSSEAYNQYLLGLHLNRRGSLADLRRAIEAYSKAIALDPNYAAAYADRALAKGFIADQTGDAGGIERAGHDADHAIALAPSDASLYAARSIIRSSLWDWPGAQADIEKALRLAPRNSDVQRRYAGQLASLGRLPEAIGALKQATELDPLSNISWESLGALYTARGDYSAADSALARANALEPTAVVTLFYLGSLRLFQGKAQEALEVFRKIDPEMNFRLTGIAMAEHSLGHADESQKALDEAIAKDAQDAAVQIAEVYAWRGEKDKAFEWLERAYRQNDGGLADLKFDSLLEPLHADPRFNALLRKLNLPVA